MNNHGGARPGTGPKPPPIDQKRVLARIDQGHTYQAIADDFGVKKHQIQYIADKLRRAGK